MERIKCTKCNIHNACWINGTQSTICVKCKEYIKYLFETKLDDIIYRIREDIIDENPADMWPEEDL